MAISRRAQLAVVTLPLLFASACNGASGSGGSGTEQKTIFFR